MRLGSVVLFLITIVGCSSAPVTAPTLSPAESATAAMQEYDTNGDGVISATEAKLTALDPKAGWDSDGDGSMSVDEIQSRLERYEALKAGVQQFGCTVRFRGDPLPNATVVFDPEPFLGAAVSQAEGVTDGYGNAEIVSPAIVEEQGLKGIRAGLYRVRITHPDEKINKKYNEETTLFFELSPMDNIVMPTFDVR